MRKIRSKPYGRHSISVHVVLS